MHRPSAARGRKLLWTVVASVGLGYMVATPEIFAAFADERSDELGHAASGENPPEYRWLDANGNSLPFQGHEELTAFLRNATVVSVKDIPEGVTKPKEVLLELDGVQAKAAFRYVSEKGEGQRLSDGTFETHFRDDYRNEVAAYDLSRLLGVDNVPPAILREIEGTPGSLQLWVEGAITLKTFDRENPGKTNPTARSRFLRHQVRDMDIWDNLIRNTDRHKGNIMWDSEMSLWLIDHTRSFSRDDTLPQPDEVVKCSRRLWVALQDLDPKQVKAVLSPYLGGPEIRALLKRQKRLVKLLQGRIEEEGEDEVLFTYAPPPSSPTGTVGSLHQLAGDLPGLLLGVDVFGQGEGLHQGKARHPVGIASPVLGPGVDRPQAVRHRFGRDGASAQSQTQHDPVVDHTVGQSRRLEAQQLLEVLPHQAGHEVTADGAQPQQDRSIAGPVSQIE